MMADGWITASYNALNQPMAMGSMGLGNNFIWYRHDPLGRCVKRWLGDSNQNPTGPTTYFYYDGWNLVQEGPNASTADRLYVHGGRVDEIVASQVSGQWYNHHYDARGHCILLTTASGVLEQQYDYDAFGYPYAYTATGVKVGLSAVKTRFLFTGREWLNDLRVYDYRNRMYQPELGRFLQPDPKQFEAGDYNLYRYCHNDPVNKSDPTGLAYDEEMLSLPEGSDTIGKAIVAATSAVAQHVSDNRYIYIGAAIAAAEGYRTRGHTSGMSPATSAMSRLQLSKQLASQRGVSQILAGKGVPIAGAGTNTVLRDAARLAEQHGGKPSEWTKISSANFRAADGQPIATHAYQHTSGKIVEMKTKFVDERKR
jgi:RHS repeat-associated protein